MRSIVLILMRTGLETGARCRRLVRCSRPQYPAQPVADHWPRLDPRWHSFPVSGSFDLEFAPEYELVTVRVIPFTAGAYLGLFNPFTLLEFDEGLSDVLYLDVDRGAFTSITGGDPQVTKYAEDFEELLEDALSAEQSIDLMRRVAEKMS